jgi:hypothetical protein
LKLPPSLVTPIKVTPSSNYVPHLDYISSSSSSDPLECFEDNIVVPATIPLPVWAQKTLESVGSEIGISSNTHRTRSIFALMNNILTIDDPSTYDQVKEKLVWEKNMSH